MALASGSERFRVPKTSSEESGLVNDTVPPSTKYKNKWAVNIFAEWQSLREVKVPVLDCGGVFKDYELHKVCALSADIAAMDVLSLKYWLSKFVMEVAKKSGERYPPKSVYGIICSLKRHLEERNGSQYLRRNNCVALYWCELIKIQVSWSVSWSVFELTSDVSWSVCSLGIKIHAPDRIKAIWLGHQCMNN